MQAPIPAKNFRFRRGGQRRFGLFAIVFAFILSLVTTLKTSLHRLPLVGDDASLRLSISATVINSSSDKEGLPRLDRRRVELLMDQRSELMFNKSKANRSHIDQRLQFTEPLNPRNELIINRSKANRSRIDQKLQDMEPLNPRNELMLNESKANHSRIDQKLQDSEPLNPQNELMLNKSKANHSPIDQKLQDVQPLNPRNELVFDKSERNAPQIQQKLSPEPLCRVLKTNADYCELKGDVRVDPNSSTIFLVEPRSMISATSATNSWIIEPYPRKNTGWVKKWTVKLATADDSSVPNCSEIHSQPALLFSINGFTGNHFHDFADVLVPLFATSFPFNTDVQFLAADYEPMRWWPLKYKLLLSRLSRHAIIDIDNQKIAHCCNHLIAGLKFHGELVVDPSSGLGLYQFRQLLRRTYSLNRDKAIQYTEAAGGGLRPRLMIVSRKGSRILTNEDQISETARKLGFEVVSGEGSSSGNLTEFAQVVNSCDVMMGVHGAGLTNMVFLPEKAVLVQILPLGDIGYFGRLYYGNPSIGMNLRYLEYQIEANESSLIRRYPIDDPVIRDPKSVTRQGWKTLFEVYLRNQNVTIDVRRFRATLTQALDLLRS